MRTLARLVAVISLALASFGATCNGQPVMPDAAVVEVTDAGSVPSDADTPCGLACANIARLGCEEGNPPCATTCEHILATRLVRFDTDCMTAAKSKQEARSCPAIVCK